MMVFLFKLVSVNDPFLNGFEVLPDSGAAKVLDAVLAEPVLQARPNHTPE